MLRWRRIAPGASPEPAVGGQEREPGGGPAAARRAVDLAVGEDGDVALGERDAGGPVGLGRRLVLPEDDAVDAAQLGLVGVDDVERRVERRAQLALEGDERRQAGRRHVEADGRGRRPSRRRRRRS